MDKKDIVKWVLIAGAAYLAWRWLQSSGILGLPAATGTGTGAGAGTGTGAGAGTSTGTGTGTGTGAGAGTGTGTSTGTQTQTGGGTGTAPVATPSTADLMAAASDQSKAGITGSFKLTGHQWNWYRAEYFTKTLNQPYDKATMSPDLDSVIDPNVPMTAAQYWGALSNLGLSGLGWGSGLGYGYSGMRTIQ